MPRARPTTGNQQSEWDAIPFPIQERISSSSPPKPSIRAAANDAELAETTDDVLAAFATVSRRINDLARELKCLGYFDDEGDRPRAA